MGTIRMKFPGKNGLTTWNLSLPWPTLMSECICFSVRVCTPKTSQSIINKSLKWYQNVTKGWVTDVLSKVFGIKNTFLISVARRHMFSKFTYSIGSIIVHKLKIFYFCSLIIPSECQRSPLLLGLFFEKLSNNPSSELWLHGRPRWQLLL